MPTGSKTGLGGRAAGFAGQGNAKTQGRGGTRRRAFQAGRIRRLRGSYFQDFAPSRYNLSGGRIQTLYLDPLATGAGDDHANHLFTLLHAFDLRAMHVVITFALQSRLRGERRDAGNAGLYPLGGRAQRRRGGRRSSTKKGFHGRMNMSESLFGLGLRFPTDRLMVTRWLVSDSGGS